MTIEVPADVQRILDEAVAAGEFSSPAEALAAGARMLHEWRQRRLDELRRQIDEGAQQIARGEYVELGVEAELRRFFDDIERRALARLAHEQDEV
jgi:Arc/MetJ-type ribon-helix-helix transcriptional regulator